MEVVVISNPEPIENESTIINELFREELSVLHLRRPNATENELDKLIEKIDEQHHDKIALHQHFGLAEKFKISRLHFSEKNRLLYSYEKLMGFKDKGFTLSTSVHTSPNGKARRAMEDYNGLSQLFQYVFIGPVFESISKVNYKPSYNIVEQVNKMVRQTHHDTAPTLCHGELAELCDGQSTVHIYGIGGIDHTKLEQMKAFDGAALLGAIWQNPENAIDEFKKCRKIASMY